MSSGQQVIGICVFLFIAVVCFALGVLVGRYEPSIEEKALNQLGARAESAPATGSGTQVSPRVDTAPTAEREPARDIAPAARGAVSRPEERTGPRVTELPPLPSPAARQTASAAPSAAAPQAPAEPAPAPAPTPAVAPQRSAPPAPAPAESPAAPAAAPAPSGMTQQTLDREVLAALDPLLPTPAPTPATPAAPKPPAPAPSTALPAPAPSGTTQGWAVQFGWFSGEGHQKRAENMRDQVRAKAKLEAAVVPSADKKEHRVVVFYKDKATAQNAAAQLRKTPDFKDVFVKELP